MVERLVWGQEVPGSNPGTPTIHPLQEDADIPALVAQVAQRCDLFLGPGNDEHVAGFQFS